MKLEKRNKKFVKKLSKDKKMLKGFVKAYDYRVNKVSELALSNAKLSRKLADAEEIIALLDARAVRTENELMVYKLAYAKLLDDDTAKTPQERGQVERKQKDGVLMQRRVCRGFLHINNQRYFDEVLQELHGELLAVRDTGDGYEVYRANNLLCQFDKIATNKE